MDPKEKADKLVEKYLNIPRIDGVYRMTTYEAIQCAIIAVDEIIKEIESFSFGNEILFGSQAFQESKLTYWKSVKEHLNKMVTYESRRTSI